MQCKINAKEDRNHQIPHSKETFIDVMTELFNISIEITF